MELIIEKHSDSFIIQTNDKDGWSRDYDDVMDYYRISPFDFYGIFVKYGAIWSIEEWDYKFNSVESAKKAIEEIESYLVLNKLTE